MAISTVDEFLTVLERSKLLKPEELAEARRLAQENADVTALAKTLVRQGMLSRWQAGQLLAGRSTFFLGKYKLIELLGKGGMGSVFLSEHVMMNRRVALKIIPRHVSKDPAGLERFLSEARTIASVDHPNIVQAYNVDNEEDLFYLVMEYVDGLDLQRLVEAEGPLDCPSAVDYVRQAAEGLAHAHARKMVHCDIKPSNLIVSPQGVVKILDMGLARLVSPGQVGSEPSEADERILGSVDYLAPEQALRTADFDHRADVYSLGCTLYFLLTGHAPFPEGTLTERILKHQTQQPPDIAAERHNVPQSLIEICQKMMAKRPADRYQTAAEVSRVLAAWRPGEQRVQRVLTMKKAQPVDELPGPDLLGMDLSELFRKGMGISTTSPIISRKTFEPPEKKIFGVPITPLRIVLSASAATLAVILLAIGLIWFFGRNERTEVAQNEGAVVGKNRPEKDSPSPPTGMEGEQSESDKKQEGGEETTAKTTPPKPPPPEPTDPSAEKVQTPSGGDVQTPSGDVQTPSGDVQTPSGDVQTPSGDVQTPPAGTTSEPPKFEPFKDLAASINLPEISKSERQRKTSAQGMSLGLVHLPSGAALALKLVGGDKVMKGIGSLVMEEDTSGGPPQNWHIYFESIPQDSSMNPVRRPEIAQLTFNENKLIFRWLPRVTPTYATYAEALKKCGILFMVEGDEQFMQLSRPQQANPLELDLETGVAEVNLQSKMLTEAHNVRVQILDREGAFPRSELDPGNILDPKSESKSETYLVFPDKKYFKVKISASLKARRLDIKASAIYDLPNQQSQKTFTSNELYKLENQHLEKQKETQKKLADDNSRKAELAPQLEELKKITELFNDLRQLCLGLNKQSKIHYRVFIPYDNYQVELFNTHVTTP